MDSKQEILNEINNQILSLMVSKNINVSVQKKDINSNKIKILSELEPLEEGFLIVSKK